MNIGPLLSQLEAARVPGQSPRDVISELAETQAPAATLELFRMYDTHEGVLIDWKEGSISEPQDTASEAPGSEITPLRRRPSTEFLKAWAIQFVGSVAVYAGMDYLIDDENAWPHVTENPITLTTMGVVASVIAFANRKKISRECLPPSGNPRLQVGDARPGSVEMAEKMLRSEQMDKALFIADEEYDTYQEPRLLPESFGLGDDLLDSQIVLEWLRKHDGCIPGFHAIKLIIPEYDEETERYFEKRVWGFEINPARIVSFLMKDEDNPDGKEDHRTLKSLSCLQDIQIAQVGLSERGDERMRTERNVTPMDPELRMIQKQELARIKSETQDLARQLSFRTLDLITASLVQRTEKMGQVIQGRIDDIELRLELDSAQVETFPFAEYIAGVQQIRNRLAEQPILDRKDSNEMQGLLDSLEEALFPE